MCFLRLPCELQVLVLSHLDAASTLQLANCFPLIANLITSPLEWNNLLRKINLDTKGITSLTNFMKTTSNPVSLLRDLLRSICCRYSIQSCEAIKTSVALHIEGEEHILSPEGFLLVEQAQAESNTVYAFCQLRQVKTCSWLGGTLLVALASQARRQQEPVANLTALGLCSSSRVEDEAMIQLLGRVLHWKISWLDIIASRLDHRGLADLADVLERGRLEHLDAKKEVLLRGSKADLKRMWRATISSWRLGRKAALKPGQEAEDGWDMVEEILSGGRQSAKQAMLAFRNFHRVSNLRFWQG